MATLRSDEGCPWDREQTHDSLKRYVIEEAYELLEAIEAEDDEALVDELGDVLLQVVFHAQIAAEENRFTMADVIEALRQKLIRRHPHVFGDAEAEDAKEVVRTWAEVKRQERAANASRDGEPRSLLASVPRSLPALMEAEQVQRRAAQVDFQWDDISGAWAKVNEELDELQRAAQSMAAPAADTAASQAAVADELGDVLFAVVNVARYLGVDAEQSLRETSGKFRRRFAHIEARARETGRALEEMTLEEMDALWDEAKGQRRG